MRFPPFPFAVLDTETTGFLPRVHHIVELAAERYEKGKIAETFEELVFPKDEIPPHVQVLTRIKPEMLVGKPPIMDAADAFQKALGDDSLLVGQNLGYDIGMLKGDGIDLSSRPWVDTSLLASLVFPELRSYSLQYLSNALSLPHEPQHRALGDVRATSALFLAIWERLCELPTEKIAEAKSVMAKASDGYRILFESLPDTGGKGAWLALAREKPEKVAVSPMALPKAVAGTVTLVEEPLDPTFLTALIAGAAKEKSPTWIAVKNLDSAIRRHALPEGVAVLHPSAFLLDESAATSMREQKELLPEEATLTLKISWFKPRVRADLALHAGERDTWNGKIACTDDHPTYVAQSDTDARVRLVDHRQLLTFLSDPTKSEGIMPQGVRVIIDDASMLEDTATKAFGAMLPLDNLRAAAQGHPLLTQLADRAALWAETMRGGIDQYILTGNDLARKETNGLKQLLSDVLADSALPPRVLYLLSELQKILTPTTKTMMLSWIETKAQSGSVTLFNAPEQLEKLLKESLFDKYATILLIPPGLKGLHTILSEEVPQTLTTITPEEMKSFAITMPDSPLEDFLRDPPPGKSIGLVGSKRLIEMAFIQHTERLEAKGVTLICQGLSGGQGRMESDFLGSEGTTVWLLTPWMYEGVDLQSDSVDHLVLDSLPFDHPGQIVFSKRKDLFRNGFEDYALPRLLQRLFRLLRTFARHRTETGDVTVLDQRMKERAYGERVRTYLSSFSKENVPAFKTRTIAKKASAKKKKDDQPSLPI